MLGLRVIRGMFSFRDHTWESISSGREQGKSSHPVRAHREKQRVVNVAPVCTLGLELSNRCILVGIRDLESSIAQKSQ